MTLGKDLICRVHEKIHSEKIPHSANIKFPVVLGVSVRGL
jgi:hypothetical protein